LLGDSPLRIFEELRDAVSSIGHPLARTERAGRVQWRRPRR